jgi:hypothetical protein
VQAEGRAEALADVNQDNLATKTDLAELKAELLKWMIGAMTAQTVAVIAAVAESSITADRPSLKGAFGGDRRWLI